KLAKIPGMQTYLQSVQDVRTGGRATRTQYQYALEDADVKELSVWAPRMVDAMKTLPELKDVATDLQVQGLQMDVKIDRDTASELGILPQNIDDTLYDAFGQRLVAITFTQTNQYYVVLEMKPDLAQNPEAIEMLYVRAPSGAPVPLSMVTKISPSMTAL